MARSELGSSLSPASRRTRSSSETPPSSSSRHRRRRERSSKRHHHRRNKNEEHHKPHRRPSPSPESYSRGRDRNREKSSRKRPHSSSPDRSSEEEEDYKDDTLDRRRRHKSLRSRDEGRRKRRREDEDSHHDSDYDDDDNFSRGSRSHRTTKRSRRERERRRERENRRSSSQRSNRHNRRNDHNHHHHHHNEARPHRQMERHDAAHRAGAGIVSDDDEYAAASNAVVAPPPSVADPDRRRTHPYHARTQSPSSHDDLIGHFQGGPGTVIADRYRIVQQVGLGTFGKVMECLDLKHHQRHSPPGRGSNDRYVAIKIVRNVKRYCESARVEADIVSQINRRGGRGVNNCVLLHDAFHFSGHFCLVFESLGPSLYDFLKRNNHRAFPMICVQDFTVQLLETMEFLHSFGLIHTDLKIENILLMNARETTYRNQRVPQSTRIKLIDFGGACYDNAKKSSIINTRQYRAPEVIMEAGWSMPSDIWSLGCILAELYRGELLFPTHENVEHLALMERTIGPFPRRILQRATKYVNEAFDLNGRHRMGRVLKGESLAFVKNSPTLQSIVCNPEDDWFLHLLNMVLRIDPEERCTAHECLRFLARIRRDRVQCA